MADTTIPIGLDPRAAIEGLDKLSKSTAELSDKMEEALGKDVPKSVKKMEDAAEKGSTRIAGFFRNLGSRVKEDLKTAFDLGAVTEGAKFAKGIGDGIKQVFDMEKAFDRLNTRLGLSASKMDAFKKSMNEAVAGTGQKLQDVLPGVETAAAKGGVKSPQQLTAIGQTLGRARAITGEDTQGLSDSVVEILKDQGRQVTSDTFKETMDALEGTRVSGAFGSANDAASAIKNVTGSISADKMRELGLTTRNIGGMAATASVSGQGGTQILQHILETGANKPGGQQLINSMFGADIFKNGKMDPTALKNINKNGMGQYSESVLADTLGTDQAGLSRFIDSFKANMSNFAQVTQGANETSSQFDTATDNLASKLDQFKEHVLSASRSVFGALSEAGNSLLHGDVKGVAQHLGSAAGTAWDNKGTIGMALGATTLAGIVAGGSMNRLLGKVGGGLVAGEAAKAAGVTPVYVVNAAEIGGGGAGGAAGLVSGGLLAKLGKGAGLLGTGALWGGAAAAAGAAGYGVGLGINYLTGNDKGGMGAALYDLLHPDDDKTSTGQTLDPKSIEKAVHDGTVAAHQKTNQGAKAPYISPSDLSGGRGGGR